MRKSNFFSDLNDVTKYVVHLRISSHCFWYEKCLITFLWRNFHRFFGRGFFYERIESFGSLNPEEDAKNIRNDTLEKLRILFFTSETIFSEFPCSLHAFFKNSTASNRHPSVKLNDLLQNIYGQTETSVCFTSIHDELIKIGCLLPTL